VTAAPVRPAVVAPLDWGLTPQQRRLFQALVARPVAGRAWLEAALDKPGRRALDNHIAGLRSRLAAFGIRVGHRRGGWFLPAPVRARFGFADGDGDGDGR
jgi:hypothetical protein